MEACFSFSFRLDGWMDGRADLGWIRVLCRGGCYGAVLGFWYVFPFLYGYLILMRFADEASYVNGQALIVDGGLTASMPVVPGKIA